jgi:O-Antigen ligase
MTGSSSLVVYGALLALLAVGTIIRPAVALAAVTCIFGLKQWGQSTNAWLAQHSPLTNIAVGILVLAAIGTTAVRGRCILCNIPRITWYVLALFIYALLSLAWTPRPDLALTQWANAYPYLITYIVLAPLVVQETADFRSALHWTVGVGGLLVIALLAFGHWGDRGLIIASGVQEEETNPLALAGLGGSVATAAMFLRTYRISLLTWALRLALVGASLLLIVKSGSRGQLVASVAALLIMLPVAYRIFSLQGVATAVIGSIVVGVTVAYGLSEFVDLGDERWTQARSVADANGRIAMISTLLSEWQKNPGTMLFGLGNSAAYDPALIGIYPHDVPLETLGEEGVVGFLLYVAIVLESLIAVVRASRAARDSTESRGLVGALSSGLLFFFLISLKQGNMIGSVEFFLYAVLLGRLAQSLTNPAVGVSSTGPFQGTRPTLFQNLLR